MRVMLAGRTHGVGSLLAVLLAARLVDGVAEKERIGAAGKRASAKAACSCRRHSRIAEHIAAQPQRPVRHERAKQTDERRVGRHMQVVGAEEKAGHAREERQGERHEVEQEVDDEACRGVSRRSSARQARTYRP